MIKKKREEKIFLFFIFFGFGSGFIVHCFYYFLVFGFITDVLLL